MDSEELTQLSERFKKMMFWCYLIKNQTYEGAIKTLDKLLRNQGGSTVQLNAFDASYVLAVMFDKEKEDTLEDLISYRELTVALCIECERPLPPRQESGLCRECTRRIIDG